MIMKHVLIAIDSFKGSLTSLQAGQAAAEGIPCFELDKIAPKPDRSKTMNFVFAFILALFTFNIVFIFLFLANNS